MVNKFMIYRSVFPHQQIGLTHQSWNLKKESFNVQCTDDEIQTDPGYIKNNFLVSIEALLKQDDKNSGHIMRSEQKAIIIAWMSL